MCLAWVSLKPSTLMPGNYLSCCLVTVRLLHLSSMVDDFKLSKDKTNQIASWKSGLAVINPWHVPKLYLTCVGCKTGISYVVRTAGLFRYLYRQNRDWSKWKMVYRMGFEVWGLEGPEGLITSHGQNALSLLLVINLLPVDRVWGPSRVKICDCRHMRSTVNQKIQNFPGMCSWFATLLVLTLGCSSRITSLLCFSACLPSYSGPSGPVSNHMNMDTPIIPYKKKSETSDMNQL